MQYCDINSLFRHNSASFWSHINDISVEIWLIVKIIKNNQIVVKKITFRIFKISSFPALRPK